MNLRNVFILFRNVLPKDSNIENWDIIELCYLHEEQIKSGGDVKYIEKLKKLIKNKVKSIILNDEVPNDIICGTGCCSEYRNSVIHQYGRILEIIK